MQQQSPYLNHLQQLSQCPQTPYKLNQIQPSQLPSTLPPSSDYIQKCLDENRQLILAILDNQNLGKLAVCAQYQVQLQQNLLQLAAIADGQQQISPARPQMPSGVVMHPGIPCAQQPVCRPPWTSIPFHQPQVLEQPPQHVPSYHTRPSYAPAHVGLQPSLPALSHGMDSISPMDMPQVVMQNDGNTIGGGNSRPSSANPSESDHGSAPGNTVDVHETKQDAAAAAATESTSDDDGSKDSGPLEGSREYESHD